MLSPEQEEESINLQHNANDGPTDQNHTHASQEEAGGLHLVLLKEESKRPLQADDKCQSSNKQDLQEEKKNGSSSRNQSWPRLVCRYLRKGPTAMEVLRSRVLTQTRTVPLTTGHPCYTGSSNRGF